MIFDGYENNHLYEVRPIFTMDSAEGFVMKDRETNFHQQDAILSFPLWKYITGACELVGDLPLDELTVK